MNQAMQIQQTKAEALLKGKYNGKINSPQERY